MEIKYSEMMNIIRDLNLNINASEIKSDTPFEEAGFDSLDRMNLFLDMEERFHIKIPDEVFSKLGSIDDIIEYLKNINVNE